MQGGRKICRWRVKFIKCKKFVNECTTNGQSSTFLSLPSQNTAPAVWELQTGGASHRGWDTASADPAEGRRAHLRYLPQDQVCWRLWPPLLLLPDQILRSLWRASLSALQQCEEPHFSPSPSSSHTHLIPAVADVQLVLLLLCLLPSALSLPGHTLVRSKCIGRMACHRPFKANFKSVVEWL